MKRYVASAELAPIWTASGTTSRNAQALTPQKIHLEVLRKIFFACFEPAAGVFVADLASGKVRKFQMRLFCMVSALIERAFLSKQQ